MALRILTALALLVNGWIHLDLWFDWARFMDVVGPAFLVNAAAAVVIAGLLVVRTGRVELLLAAGFGLATLGAFLISTTPAGFFGVREPWDGAPQLVSAATDVLVVVGAVVIHLRERGPRG